MLILPWCFGLLFCPIFFFIVYKNVRMKTLNKIQCLYIYTGFRFLCQALLTLGSFNSLILSHWGGWPKPVPSKRVFTRVPSKFVEQDFLPIKQGNNGVGSLAWGMPRVSWHLYSGWNGHSKNWCMVQHIHSTAPVFWACNLWNKERCSWSNWGQSYLLILTGVNSTSTTGMPTLTSTHPFPSILNFSPFIYPGSSGKHPHEHTEFPFQPS